MDAIIRCTQDALWDALTKADDMQPITSPAARFAMLRQVTTEMDPKTRIAMTFERLFMGPDAPASHMVYVIEP